MILLFEKNDITKLNVDAIVNATNNTLLGRSEVDDAIYFAAGPKLLEKCRKLGGCETGEAKITKGYNLTAKYVIHTVGPVYVDGKHNEKKLLSNCYKNSLLIAKEKKLKSIAFPLISTGNFGYPKDKAFDVAVESIKSFFTGENVNINMTVMIVLYEMPSLRANTSKIKNLKKYIENNYVSRQYDLCHNISVDEFPVVPLEKNKLVEDIGEISTIDKKSIKKKSHKVCNKLSTRRGGGGGGSVVKKSAPKKVCIKDTHLAEKIKNVDKSFSDTLIALIDVKGLKDVEVYNKANIDRKLFSKIRSGRHPSKNTAIALCIALELNLKETNNLLSKAGYILSDSEYFDVIIKYHIEKKIYDVTEINRALFDYDQKQIGIV